MFSLWILTWTTLFVWAVSDALVANFVPSKNPQDFVGFMEAIWEKHSDLIATGGDREDYIRNTYLNENPRQLGGRAVGRKGQSGSNNFGEKKNHLIESYWKYLTKNIKASQGDNPAFMIVACALDLRLGNDLKSTFAVIPVCETHDYDLLRHINSQAINGFNTLCLDLQYMVVTNSTDPTKKKQLDSCEVIGNPNASFTVKIPTASQVYSTLRQVEKTRPDTSVTSFFEQSAHPVQVGGVATNI